jgi:WD40 repeat protein
VNDFIAISADIWVVVYRILTQEIFSIHSETEHLLFCYLNRLNKSLLAFTTGDNQICIWNIEEKKIVKNLRQDETDEEINSIVHLKNYYKDDINDFILTSTSERRVNLWRMRDSQIVKRFSLGRAEWEFLQLFILKTTTIIMYLC